MASPDKTPRRCDNCARFIGEDCVEGVDWAAGIQQNGDVAWTGQFYCPPGKGCNRAGFEWPEFFEAVPVG